MAKYLRDISIHVSDFEELPSGKKNRDFNNTTHNVQNIFFYQIPKKFEFEGISKLNISIAGSPKANQKLSRFLDGIVEYNYSGFDFEKYFTLSKREQNFEILRILRTTISDISKDGTDEKNTLLKIIDSIPENNFEWTRESKKLSKPTKDKKFLATISVKINADGQNAFLDITHKDGEIIIHDHLITNIVYEFGANLYSSKWEGYVFKIFDRDGKVFKEYSVVA